MLPSPIIISLGPGLSSQVGLVTVDQAPVAVVVTGLACVAQGPAEPLAVPAGPDSEPELETTLAPDLMEDFTTTTIPETIL